jgi:hypothetical protein
VSPYGGNLRGVHVHQTEKPVSGFMRQQEGAMDNLGLDVVRLGYEYASVATEIPANGGT